MNDDKKKRAHFVQFAFQNGVYKGLDKTAFFVIDFRCTLNVKCDILCQLLSIYLQITINNNN